MADNLKRLKDAYSDYFDIGVALSNNSSQAYSDEVYDNFSTFTCENEMKWAPIHPEEDKYVFEGADNVANLARKLGIKMRAHTLVWHFQTPDWVGEVPEGTSVDDTIIIVLKRIEEHFITINERYGDVIKVWDICNEVISDEDNNAEQIYRTNSLYYKACGCDDAKFEYFISEVFKLVERINPNVIRYYNEYELEFRDAKRKKTMEFIRRIIALGAKVDGLGLQSHIFFDNNCERFSKVIDEIKATGFFKEISITELDLSIYRTADDKEISPVTDEILEKQAELYSDVFEMFRKHADFIANVSFWGISDAFSWLNYFPVKDRTNYPLLFDRNGEKKPAYYSVLDF